MMVLTKDGWVPIEFIQQNFFLNVGVMILMAVVFFVLLLALRRYFGLGPRRWGRKRHWFK